MDRNLASIPIMRLFNLDERCDDISRNRRVSVPIRGLFNLTLQKAVEYIEFLKSKKFSSPSGDYLI